jgi:hypothetical protein
MNPTSALTAMDGSKPVITVNGIELSYGGKPVTQDTPHGSVNISYTRRFGGPTIQVKGNGWEQIFQCPDNPETIPSVVALLEGRTAPDDSRSQGQLRLLMKDALPKPVESSESTALSTLESWGFRIHGEAKSHFPGGIPMISVTYPAGWEVRAEANNQKRCEILDNSGIVRAVSYINPSYDDSRWGITILPEPVLPSSFRV